MKGFEAVRRVAARLTMSTGGDYRAVYPTANRLANDLLRIIRTDKVYEHITDDELRAGIVKHCEEAKARCAGTELEMIEAMRAAAITNLIPFTSYDEHGLPGIPLQK